MVADGNTVATEAWGLHVQVRVALDAIELVSKLRVAHHQANTDPSKKSQRHMGLNLTDNTIQNSIENGVVEPMISKLKALKFATEAAVTILRIDDLIKLDPEEQQGR